MDITRNVLDDLVTFRTDVHCAVGSETSRHFWQCNAEKRTRSRDDSQT
jgi:hypothetical protein